MARLPDDVEVLSPIAQGRNINGLTEDQVGVKDGWRLVVNDERPDDIDDLEFWGSVGQYWFSSDRSNKTGFHSTHDYRTKAPLKGKSPIAKGRNIAGLTEEQVGVKDGWRLITEEETSRPPLDAQRWDEQEWQRRMDPPGYYIPSGIDYRTKAPLPEFIPSISIQRQAIKDVIDILNKALEEEAIKRDE